MPRGMTLSKFAASAQIQFRQRVHQSYWVPLVAAELGRMPGESVPPLLASRSAATSTEAKVAETEAALRVGAQESTWCKTWGPSRGGDYDVVRSDIAAVVAAAHRAGAIVKVILETALPR